MLAVIVVADDVLHVPMITAAGYRHEYATEFILDM